MVRMGKPYSLVAITCNRGPVIAGRLFRKKLSDEKHVFQFYLLGYRDPPAVRECMPSQSSGTLD